LPHGLGQQSIGQKRASVPFRRHKLGHYPITVGDQDSFSIRGQANVLAKLVLQDFQPDGSHG
jgi:hypothetical protein